MEEHYYLSRDYNDWYVNIGETKYRLIIESDCYGEPTGMFADKRKRGEWFSLTSEDIEVVKDIMRNKENYGPI